MPSHILMSVIIFSVESTNTVMPRYTANNRIMSFKIMMAQKVFMAIVTWIAMTTNSGIHNFVWSREKLILPDLTTFQRINTDNPVPKGIADRPGSTSCGR